MDEIDFEVAGLAAILAASGHDAIAIMKALLHMYASTNDADAERWYWAIDNSVVVQGTHSGGSVEVCKILLRQLPRATEVGQRWLVRLVAQLVAGSGQVAGVPDPQSAVEQCRLLLAGWVDWLYGLALSRDPEYHETAIEMLVYCDMDRGRLTSRIDWFLSQRPDSESSRHLRHWLNLLQTT